MGDRERIGDEVAIGHLTSATLLEPGAAYHVGGDGDLHADAEVAFQLGRNVDPDADAAAARQAIAGVGAALENVDLASPRDDPVSVVAGTMSRVAFGPSGRGCSRWDSGGAGQRSGAGLGDGGRRRR